MQYRSTRGQAPELSFEEVVLTGLAEDGGLYVPTSLPQFSADELEAMAALSYEELFCRIVKPFVGDCLSDDELRTLTEKAYAPFRHSAIAPLKQLGPQAWVLELFHGPTLAFKDFALQFLGQLMAHILKKRGEKVVVLGATSGDTGSAAIAGCRGLPNMDIYILFPNGRVSDVQRRQMTTIDDANVHNIALEGTFDDCQHIVKTLFVDAAFKQEHRLVAVNSINWARILAQVVYYFYAGLALGAPQRAVAFSVPTGNFGDIYAGWLAKRMGLPVADLVIATNTNDILARCVATGTYSMNGVVHTISPSMDIQVSSNFERLLFDLYDGDADAVFSLMASLKQNQSFTLGDAQHAALCEAFSSASADDETTKAVIRDVYARTGELLDPHTAVGVKAAELSRRHPDAPMVTLATAHPAKFPDAVVSACGATPVLPEFLSDLFERDERFDVLANDPEAIKRYIGG